MTKHVVVLVGVLALGGCGSTRDPRVNFDGVRLGDASADTTDGGKGPVYVDPDSGQPTSDWDGAALVDAGAVEPPGGDAGTAMPPAPSVGTYAIEVPWTDAAEGMQFCHPASSGAQGTWEVTSVGEDGGFTMVARYAGQADTRLTCSVGGDGTYTCPNPNGAAYDITGLKFSADHVYLAGHMALRVTADPNAYPPPPGGHCIVGGVVSGTLQ